MKKKIFFTCLQLSKKGVKIIESEHTIRPIVSTDYNIGEYPLKRSDFVKLYGNLIIEKVKSFDRTIHNYPTKKEYLEKYWANEFPTNVIESKSWNYKKSKRVKNTLIKRMDTFLGEWATTDIKAKEKLKAIWEQWKHTS